jgi:hypothetical protein
MRGASDGCVGNSAFDAPAFPGSSLGIQTGASVTLSGG